MLISKAMAARLNDQITMELGAAHKYRAMACALDAMGLKVAAKFFFKQSEEEDEHAMKILHYVLEVGATVSLAAVAKPKGDYASLSEVADAALESEMAVTKSINEIMDLCEKEKDYATRNLMAWFVEEQVEEVSTMNDLINLINLAGKNVLQVEARLAHMMAAEKK